MKTESELLETLVLSPPIASLWKHYKEGTVYRVIGWALLEATREPLVLYQSVHSSLVWARPLAQWIELVEHEGQRVPRYTRLA